MISKNSNYRKTQHKLKADKCVAEYEIDDLDYLRKPLGKANYAYPKENLNEDVSECPEKTKNVKSSRWNDKIVCDVCNKTYNRSGVTSHRGTKMHQAYLNVNKKLVGLITKDL